MAVAVQAGACGCHSCGREVTVPKKRVCNLTAKKLPLLKRESTWSEPPNECALAVARSCPWEQVASLTAQRFPRAGEL